MPCSDHVSFPCRLPASVLHCALTLALLSVPVARGDSWQSRAPVPGARAAHSVVWTGREAIVWGGGVDGNFLNTGARYSPSTDTWRATATDYAPSPRWFQAAVWTGSEMIVWGGRASFEGNGNFNDGGRYNPASDAWLPMSGVGAPAPRSQCVAVWTGEEMIIWGGETEGGVPLADGAAYNPDSDTWRSINGNSGLSPRMEPTAVWTGSEMIVFGGVDAMQPGWLSFGDGARYNPFTDSWTPLASAGVPGSRTAHTAVWTGERMIIWGGRELPSDSRLNDGAIYNPGSDTWTGISPYDAPQARALHAAVWTGTEMIVWGGDISGSLLNTGARYNPATGIWTPTTQDNAPGKRMFWRPDHGIWTGKGMLVCAGSDYPASLDSTALYTVFDPPCPPVIREQPQSVSVVVGSPVTLAVGAGDCATAAHPSATQTSAGPHPQSFEFETGARAGLLQLEYDFFSIPDSLRVYYEGQIIFDSSLSGQGTIRVPFGPGSARRVNIVVNEESGPASTAWEYTVSFRPPPLRYQWRKDGAALAGETNATLHFSSVSLADAGDYSVVVANNGSAVVSAVTTLAVRSIPPTNCVTAPPGLVSWWSAEGDADDRTGLNHGVLLGGVTYAPGKVGGGFLFPTGGVGAVKFAASPSLDVGAGAGFTVEGWIRRTSPIPSGPIAEWSDGNRWGSHFWVLNGSLYGNLTGPGGEWHLVLSDTPVPVGVWHHVALTYDKAVGQARLYLNGTVVADENIGVFAPETAFDFYLGRRPAPDADLQSFNGLLDEFSLYRGALSTGEIAAIHLAGQNGKCATNPPPVVIHDVSQDFSTSANPTGVWSYGYSATLGGTFHLLTFPKSYGANNGVPISGWQVTDAWGPSVNRVMGNGIAVSEGGAFTAPSGTVYVWPGNDGSPGVFGVIRFTVPAGGGGVYRIESAAKSNFDGPVSGDSDFHVLKNGQELFGQFLPPNSATGWSNALALASGDAVDFVVGKGADGLNDHSSLKVLARITPVTNVPPAIRRFDLSDDFSLAANPNGAWSYGHLTGGIDGAFALFETTDSFGSENGVPILLWRRMPPGKPWVAKVVGPETAVSYLFNAPAGTIYFGADPDAVPENFATIRFTVPTNAGGAYRLTTSVRSLYDSTRSADADFHVMKNGVELFGRVVPPNSGTGYSNTLLLAAGDRIDFVAGRGTNALPETGLKIQATLSSIIEASVSLDTMSFVAAGGFRVAGHAPHGTICRVERSMNLVHWEPAGPAVEVASGVFEFIDSHPPPGTACFYRLLSSEP